MTLPPAPPSPLSPTSALLPPGLESGVACWTEVTGQTGLLSSYPHPSLPSRLFTWERMAQMHEVSSVWLCGCLNACAAVTPSE